MVPSRLTPLIYLGQLALTAYVGHLLILALIVRPGPDTLAQGVLATAGTVLVLMVFASLWRVRFNRGPLEVLLRAPKLRRPTLEQASPACSGLACEEAFCI